jgi:hypothetical protein
MTDERIVGHLRAGLAATVTRQRGSGGLRASVTVELTVEGLAEAPQQPVLAVAGPGDVVRLDASQVAAQFPSPDSRDMPHDLFAFVEFVRGDLPWLFSPFGPDAGGTVRPWLALLVLRASTVRLQPGQPNDTIEVAPTELPDPARVAAWAHAQFAPAVGPERARSRLVCPRQLQPATDYFACVVPTYRAGVLAAQGKPLNETIPTLLGDAWTTTGAEPVHLPVYRHWSFSTGLNGSFGALVRRLTPAMALAEVGTRPVDITAPGGGMPELSRPRRVPLEGALVPVGHRAKPQDSGFRRRILPLLDRPNTLSAPSYGVWHAGEKPTGAARRAPWIKPLNADARRRIVAALGTEVVQRHQDAFMGAIWALAGEVEAANRARRIGQMAVATGQSLLLRRLQRRFDAEDLSLLMFAAPALARTHFGEMQSFRGLLARTCLSFASLGGPLQRLLRANGPLQRRMARRSDGARVAPGSLLADVLAGALRDRPPPPSGARYRTLAQLAPRRLFPSGVIGPRATLLPTLLGGVLGPRTLQLSTPLDGVLRTLDSLVQQTAGTACIDLPGDTIPSLRTALDPGVTVPRRIRGQCAIDPALRVDDSGLDQIMVAPRLPVATAPYLTELSPDWLLPGVGEVPPDSVMAFVPNPAFIEAFLVGMNHEIGREMLWRGFPTDQRGTVFDSFWANDDRAIPSVHGWRRTLGRNASGLAASGTVLLLRGELLRRFPTAAIFLHPAQLSNGQWVPDPAVGPPRSIAPGFVRTIDADQRLMGFPLPPAALRGGDPVAPGGYFLVFQEPAQSLRFGPPSGAVFAANGYLDLGGTAVEVASALRRQTARYYVHASRFLST